MASEAEGWVEIHRVADRKLPAFTRMIRAQLGHIHAGTSVDHIAELIQRGEIEAILSSIPLVDAENATLREAVINFHSVVEAGGVVAAAALTPEIGVSLKFDLVNPRVVEWVNQHTGQMIQSVSSSTRLAVKDIIRTAMTSGMHPTQSARLIKSVVGLDRSSAGAVARFNASLMAQGIKAERRLLLVEQLGRRYLQDRAITIARTETINAAVGGQQLAWQQAQQQGLLSPEIYEQTWIVTFDDRTCPRCRPYHGLRAPIGKRFPNGFFGPTAHPKCRCAVGIIKVAAPIQQLPPLPEPRHYPPRPFPGGKRLVSAK